MEKSLTNNQKAFKKFLEEKKLPFDEEINRKYWIQIDETENINEKVRILLEGAKQGSVFCEKELGAMYASGNGVQKNLQEAEKYLRHAAECGNLEAMYLLGLVYTNDEDRVLEALDWICKAAIEGNAAAYIKLSDYIKNKTLREQIELRLNVFYYTVFPKNPKENRTFAENRFMGWCAYEGICCIKNLEMAEMYWIEGKEEGDFICGFLLEKLFGEDNENNVIEYKKKEETKIVKPKFDMTKEKEKIKKEIESYSEKSTLITLITTFIPIFGLHRIMNGKFLSGIIFACTAGGFFVWWIIDVISILRGKFTDQYGKPINSPKVLELKLELNRLEELEKEMQN